MADGTDWVWRPVMRRFARIESYYNGELDLDKVARLNEAIDVMDENEYRAREVIRLSNQ